MCVAEGHVETITVGVAKLPRCTGIPKENPPDIVEYFFSDMDAHSISRGPFPMTA